MVASVCVILFVLGIESMLGRAAACPSLLLEIWRLQ